ncbi:MAG: DUF4392 domain-containing protein [Chloroflexi bacterium]|nr:DUF4392 domain-containing protein [Chloroflexota bacterium]MDA1270377.1 DUF4392 domain-containing protein [Chloroflexota bacterium]
MDETIEDIILDQDKRGMLTLRRHLPDDYCSQAARFVIDNSVGAAGPGAVIIVTGFYVLMAGKAETDGPPGAIAIGEALKALGRQVTYVSDRYATPLLRRYANRSDVIDFPIDGKTASKKHAAAILERVKPSLLISIERCGRTREDTYLNMRYADISAYTARLDYLFDSPVPSVGIGDGGNEIGMGNLADVIPTVDSLPNYPAVNQVDRLVIASVSNWGGYGLVAAMSTIAGRNLLPSVEAETAMLHGMVDAGLVDGTTGEAVPTADNFSAEENGALLTRLHRLVAAG